MVYPIRFVAYKLNKEDEKVMEKMGEFLEKNSGKEVHVHPIDPSIYHENFIAYNNDVVFGEKTKNFIDDGKWRWQLPDIKSLHAGGDAKLRKRAMELLTELAEEIKNYEEKKEEPQEAYVEKDEVKFGELQDIELTEKEVEHLQRIKELLGGGKIVITKGDLKIEVNDERDRDDSQTV